MPLEQSFQLVRLVKTRETLLVAALSKKSPNLSPSHQAVDTRIEWMPSSEREAKLVSCSSSLHVSFMPAISQALFSYYTDGYLILWSSWIK